MNQGPIGTVYLLLSGIVPILIFCWRLSRREHFFIHLAAGLLLYTAIDLSGGLIRFPAGSIALHALFNFGKFLALCAVMWMIYEEAPETILFCCVAGKCVMHIAEYVCSIVFFSLLSRNTPINTNDSLVTLGSLGITAALYFISYYFLSRRINTADYAGIDKRRTVIFTTLALFVTDVVTMWVRDLRVSSAVLLIIQGLMTLLCVTLLWLQLGLVMESRMRREADMIAQLRIHEQEQYAISREMVKLIGVKYHDLKAMLESRGGALSEEETSAMRAAVSDYFVPFQTGNRTLDTVLTERSIVCRKKKIRLECILHGELLNFMESMDIYSLFLNALNNAIESADLVEEEARRVIWLRVDSMAGVLRIQAQNYYRDEPNDAGGSLPSTTKQDKRHHGFGLQSMRMIAEKYGGTISVSHKDKMFTLAVALPIPSPEK